MSEQITKYKCESITLNKTIKSLQEKINALQPNSNNSGSNFMMASQFVDAFKEFMNVKVTGVFGSLLGRPSFYVKIFKEVLKSHYECVGSSIENILSEIAIKLNIQNDPKSNEILFGSLLKIFQDNW